MKKFFYVFFSILTFLYSVIPVNAIERGEVSIENRSEVSAVSKVQAQEACLLYKKDVDETILNYLANSKKHFENRAKVSFTITKYGQVKDVTLLQSSGNKKNDEFVITMVKTSTFLRFPKSISAENLTFQYYINNQPKQRPIAVSMYSTTPFMEKIMLFDSALLLGNFILKCCLFHYL